jgi:hypothetical protein
MVFGKSETFSERLCILPPTKEKGRKSFPYSLPELVQLAGGHLHTGGVCKHADQLRNL